MPVCVWPASLLTACIPSRAFNHRRSPCPHPAGTLHWVPIGGGFTPTSALVLALQAQVGLASCGLPAHPSCRACPSAAALTLRTFQARSADHSSHDFCEVLHPCQHPLYPVLFSQGPGIAPRAPLFFGVRPPATERGEGADQAPMIMLQVGLGGDGPAQSNCQDFSKSRLMQFASLFMLCGSVVWLPPGPVLRRSCGVPYPITLPLCKPLPSPFNPTYPRCTTPTTSCAPAASSACSTAWRTAW